MGGKKTDSKPAKKGGGKQPAASSPPAKPETKKDEKKGGKSDDKKGGKSREKEDTKKGRDVKKGKKEIVSESEEASEAELIKEQSEESKNEEEEEESEVDVRRRRGREKGVTALKGASKAVAGMNKGNRRRGPAAVSEEPENATRKDLAKLKGATKAMAGLAKKPLPPPKKKKSLKAASRLFMKFRQLKPRRSKKGQFKTASKLFMGFRKKFAATNLLNKKKRSAAMLKNTSKLMLGLRKSTKKQPPPPKAGDGTKQKPTFMLIRLGGNAAKTEQQEKKGPGNLFSGLFGRKKAKDKFQPKAKVLTKVSAAASWLTKRFLTKKRGYSESDKAIQDAWLTRMGAQKLPFPSQDELLRYRSNMERFPGAHRFYGQNEDVYGHPKNFEAYRHQRFPTQRYSQYGPGRYDDQSIEYYNYHDGEYDFDYQNYPSHEDGLPYDPNSNYGSYPEEDGEYDDYSGYQMEEDYSQYQENMEYYDEANHLLKSQNSYFDYEVDVHNPPNAYSSYDYDESGMGYYEDSMNPYGPMEDESFGEFSGQHGYSEMEDMDTVNYSSYGASPYAEPLNPYAQPMDDIMETDEAEMMTEHDDQFYEDQEMEDEGPAQLSLNRKYKLFPRPQVKLFGRERLDVPLPPSPRISFTNYDEDDDDEEEEEGEEEPLVPPLYQQRNPRQQPTKSLFAKSTQRNVGQPPVRGVPKLLSAKPLGKRINAYYKDHFQEMDSQEFSPRAFGSPLGQFMKRSLDPKPILKNHGGQRRGQSLTQPPAKNLFIGSNLVRIPTQPPALKHFKIPTPNNNYEKQQNPYVHQREALEMDLPDEQSHAQPYHKRFGLKLTGMDSSNFSRKAKYSASNNNNTEARASPKPSRQSLPQSPHPIQKFSNQGKDIPMPPSPNLSTRQRPLSPKPARNAFGLNNSNIIPHNQLGQIQAEIQSSLRRKDTMSSPQMAKANVRMSPSPTRMTHWTSNSKGPDATSIPPPINSSIAPSSPQPSIRRGSSFRNEQVKNRSPQPSIKLLGSSSALQMHGFKPQNNPTAPQHRQSSPLASPVLNRTGSYINRESQMPASPQSTRRSFGGVNSSYYPENEADKQMSFSPKMSRSMDGTINDQQERFSQGWSRDSEPPTEAVKPLISDQFMKNLKHQSGIKTLQFRKENTKSSPQLSQRQGSSQLISRGSQRSLSPSPPFTEQPKSSVMGRYGSIRGVSGFPPSNPGTQMLNRQGSHRSINRDFPDPPSQPPSFTEQPKSPVIGRYDGMRTSKMPPSPGAQMLNRQQSHRLINRESPEPPSQSPPFIEQPKSPVVGRYDSMRGTSRFPPPSPGTQMLNRQGSHRSINRESTELPSQSPQFNEHHKSPIMGRSDSMRGTLRFPPPSPGMQMLNRQGSHRSINRGSPEPPSQSPQFNDQLKSPVMGRYDSMQGTTQMPPSPMSQMLNRQGSHRLINRESHKPPSQSPSFTEQQQSPVIGRYGSIRGTSTFPPSNSEKQMFHRQGSNILKPREFQEGHSQSFSDMQNSPVIGKYSSIRGVPPPSPPNLAPDLKNPFWKRIGQPLVGLSQGPLPPHQLVHREHPSASNRFPGNVPANPYLDGQTQRPKSPSLSMRQTDNRAGAYGPPAPQSIRPYNDDWGSTHPKFYVGESTPSRILPPQIRLKSLGGFMSESLNQGHPRFSIKQSDINMRFQGPPSLAGANNSIPRFPHPRGMYMGPGPPRPPAEYYDGDAEEGIGRYAVVMPQVQRMGSFRGRGSLRKQPWQRHPTVNFHETPGTWSSNKSIHMPYSETLRRGTRRVQNNISGYLTHGSGGPPRNLQYSANPGQSPQWSNKMQPARSPQSTGTNEQQDENGAQDLTQLEDLQEASVLSNLKKRFERELIYTYIGSILLSLNPYKMLNIYGTDYVMFYEGKALGENPPHLFAIANVAYTKLMDAKHNQCIIISGESGSGKTEATKLVLRYLVAVNQRRGVTNQILEATPLLESFGNAKTVRNDNSSRFGKFVEIYLEEGVICGAITSQYLLEKSRIVFQAKNERNYHIFYEMLAGLPSQQKQMFYLQDAETYYYLNQGGNCEIPAKSDAEDFRRLLNAMESLSFNGEDQDSIFRILSSILHLGNVYFEKYETESQEVASVVSASEIRVVSELLQISHEGLQKAITYKVTTSLFFPYGRKPVWTDHDEETMREKIFTPLTVDSAVDARDAIAKILYSLLFSWLTDRINKLVYPRQNALSIAILDIYGFEDLCFNSFEQLCINYANEYLQFFFNKIVFKEEQEEYIREQIDWREISFNDNQAVIDLISQKPYGILRILDDQSCFPQATDHTFLQKCHYHHGTSDLYCKPKMPLPEFGIKHFAGKVTYQVHKFLDKNYDQVRQDVLDLFVNSKIKVVANLFFSHAQVLAQQKSMMGKSSTVTRKYKASTVAAKFQQSLLELVEKMERCNPFFVRCMKPNSRKEPYLFESDIVTSQLKYSGILETVRIRKEGYPVRIPFHIFLSRYRCVMDLGRNIRVDGQICVTVLRKLCPSAKPSMYCLGVSKLFMKENLYQLLESKRDQLMNKAAVTLQRYSRGYLTRKRFYTLRYRIIQLQAVARGYLARQRFHNWRKSMLKIRAVIRMYVNRRRYLRMKAEARRAAEEERRKAEQNPQKFDDDSTLNEALESILLSLRLPNANFLTYELTKREVVNVTRLEIPAELSEILRAAAGQRTFTQENVIPVQTPRLHSDTQLNLPLDINNYPMFKYVRVYFKEPLFGMLAVPLGSSLLPVEDELRQKAIISFKLILRFMGDPFLNGTQEILFGNYIIQMGLANVGLRDEILVQISNQVWRNTNPNNEERGWYILASCLSTFGPSPNLDKYLLKYVSDFAYNGYKPVCQHKLIQAIQKSQQGSETARTFPPCSLEWTASRERANMSLDVHCFDGMKISCAIHSWTDGEEIAGDVLRYRGVSEGWRGWSVSLKDGGHWTELAGQDYVLDLISNLELPREFPKQKSYFITASEGTQENHSQPNVVFGKKADTEEDVPPPPMIQAPSLPPPAVQESENYQNHADSGTIAEPPIQKGMDHYLDSLFDPVLSYGNGDLEKLAAMSQKMKGGGGVGGRDGGELPEDSNLPGEGTHHTGLDQSMYAQQQAYINQQAMLLAQQMTMQAMAIQQQMVIDPSGEAPLSHSPKPSITSQPSRSNSNRVTPTVAPMPRTGMPFQQRNGVNGSPTRTPISPSRESSFQHRPGPSMQSRPEDLIHHTKVNSEHFPQPSHNIKDIINQYKQPGVSRPPAPIVRKEPPKIFGRKIDPHEEALKILKGQMPSRPLTGPTQVSHMSYVPKTPRDTVALVKPVPSIKTKKPVTLPPISCVRPTPAPTVTVSRELSEEQENIQTQLHRQYSEEYYAYNTVPWRIYIRKEVFYPRDSFNNPLILDLIFKQIISDTLSESCIRITKEEREKMRSLLAEYRLDSVNAIADDKVKTRIVTAAREELEVYFSRLFPAAGSVGTGVQILGVSHTGIKLLKMLKSGGSTPEQLRVLRSYSYTDIMFVTVLSKTMLEFNLTNEKLILFSSRSSQVKTMIDCFLMELKKDSNYVVAIQNCVTEDKSFLSFHKGDIIRLQQLEGIKKGWKFGAIHGRAGLFPADCVQPVAAPDFVNLPADRKDEPRNRQSRAAASAAVAVAVASTAVAHEFDRKMDGSPTPSEYADSLDEYTDPSTSEITLQGSPYDMVEFAKKYFREGLRMAALAQDEQASTSGESFKQSSKKSKELKDPAEMLKYTKNPIQESLIEFSDRSMNRIAAEVFMDVMKFMGDAPLKGQSELDAVCSILKLCGEHEVMKDEGYCQIIKQITDNSSTKTDSSQRGWRLLYILTAYYKCSEVLKPYLFKFLQDTCRSPGLHYQGIAKACEQNLRKTLQYGGRTEYPSAMELKAMVAGRSSKRQLFLLPGGIERHLKIKTCSVAFDVIEEICMEMGVHKDDAFKEYAIFAVTNRGQNVRPLNRKEYILDVSSEMEQTDSNYMFWFRRVIWEQPLKFDNELYVTMHYNQVLPDYLKGLFNVLSHMKPSEQQFQQISRLAALQHRAKDSVYLPTIREVQDYIPGQYFKVVKPQSWLNMVMQHMQQIQPLSPHQGRAQFLGLVSAFPMFGSSFFYIQSCSNNMVISPCILAVNQNGLNFLNKETHELIVMFPLKDIQSTRTQRPASGFSYPYVDIMLGDMTSQRITQLQLEQGLELCRVVAAHMENLLQNRDKHLTLPPSEITLL